MATTTQASQKVPETPATIGAYGRLWQLVALAGLLLLPLIFFGYILPQTPGRLERASAVLIDQNAWWLAAGRLGVLAPKSSTQTALILLGFSALAFGLYALALYVGYKMVADRRALAFVVFAAAVFFLLSGLNLPNTTTDLFNYIVRGRLAAVHGSNPYYTTADEFPDDPFYPFASKRYTGFTGGKLPVWMMVNISLARLAGDDVVSGVLIYRLALVAFNLVNLGLLVAILRRLRSPFLLAGAIFYGWNPIVIHFGQSKTDTVMVTFLLLGALLLLGERRRLAPILLALSAFTKLITLPLAGVYLLGELRQRRWRPFFWGSLLFGLTVLLVNLIFSRDYLMIFRLMFLLGLGGDTAAEVLPGLIPNLLRLGFVLLATLVAWFQDGRPRLLFLGWAIVLVYFSLFIGDFRFAHYLTTLIAVVALALNGPLVAITLVLTFSSFTIHNWQSAFNTTFPAPDWNIASTYLLYIGLGGLALLAALGLAVWRSRQAQLARSDSPLT